MCRIILILYHEGSFVYYIAKAFATTGIAGSIFTKKIGIIAEHNNTKYKVVCSDNLPNHYSTLIMNQFYQEHYQELYSFALSLLTYNAKEIEPLLTTS